MPSREHPKKRGKGKPPQQKDLIFLGWLIERFSTGIASQLLAHRLWQEAFNRAQGWAPFTLRLTSCFRLCGGALCEKLLIDPRRLLSRCCLV
ncbi:hypothetical protein BRADI_3g44593v3 [Brachypodium distachyon]|uniref:Uncharacterized protein n=1 Tax=Brachypodium distachyon TaxID=15368 RepID=A0A2K2D367_BRADI|nr:hypothetical protein BRADI_3g44593v3 [Brachypodium distachyon]